MEVQGGIDPQFGGQMQPTLSYHLQGVVGAKNDHPSRYMLQWQSAQNQHRAAFYHLLNPCQFRCQRHFGLIPVLTAFGRPPFLRFFCTSFSFAVPFLPGAHHLLYHNGIGTTFPNMDQ